MFPFFRTFGWIIPDAQNLQPASVLANAASVAFASSAANVHFHPRLHKGKITRSKPGLDLLPEKLAQKFIHRRKKVCKGHAFVDVKAFKLMEKNMGTGRNHPRCGRRVQGQQSAIGGEKVSIAWTWTLLVWVRKRRTASEIKGILHVAGRMVGSKIQPFEIVIVGVDVRT